MRTLVLSDPHTYGRELELTLTEKDRTERRWKMPRKQFAEQRVEQADVKLSKAEAKCR